MSNFGNWMNGKLVTSLTPSCWFGNQVFSLLLTCNKFDFFYFSGFFHLKIFLDFVPHWIILILFFKGKDKPSSEISPSCKRKWVFVLIWICGWNNNSQLFSIRWGCLNICFLNSCICYKNSWSDNKFIYLSDIFNSLEIGWVLG